MKNTDCWNSSQSYFSILMVFVSLFLLIESAIACEAPTKVCDWKKKIVALKTNNMIASGILIDKGLIITNRHVVEDFQSVLVRDHVGNIERAHNPPQCSSRLGYSYSGTLTKPYPILGKISRILDHKRYTS